MNKHSKIIIAILIITILIIIPQISFAGGITGVAGSAFENIIGSSNTTTSNTNITEWKFSLNLEIPDSVFNFVGGIIRLLRNIAIMLTVGVITVLGIKYMIGSVEKKAEYKKNFKNIIIGAALISMITTVIDVIFSIIENIEV